VEQRNLHGSKYLINIDWCTYTHVQTRTPHTHTYTHNTHTHMHVQQPQLSWNQVLSLLRQPSHASPSSQGSALSPSNSNNGSQQFPATSIAPSVPMSHVAGEVCRL